MCWIEWRDSCWSSDQEKTAARLVVLYIPSRTLRPEAGDVPNIPMLTGDACRRRKDRMEWNDDAYRRGRRRACLINIAPVPAATDVQNACARTRPDGL